MGIYDSYCSLTGFPSQCQPVVGDFVLKTLLKKLTKDEDLAKGTAWRRRFIQFLKKLRGHVKTQVMDLFGWLESPPQRVIMDTNMGSLGACTPYDFQLFDECSELGFTEDFQGRECPLGEGRIHEVFHEMLRADPRWNKFFGDNAPKFALEQSVFSAQQTKPGLCHRKPKDTQDEAWEVEDSARQTGLVGAFEQFCDIFVDAWLLLGGRKGLQEAIFKEQILEPVLTESAEAATTAREWAHVRELTFFSMAADRLEPVYQSQGHDVEQKEQHQRSDDVSVEEIRGVLAEFYQIPEGFVLLMEMEDSDPGNGGFLSDTDRVPVGTKLRLLFHNWDLTTETQQSFVHPQEHPTLALDANDQDGAVDDLSALRVFTRWTLNANIEMNKTSEFPIRKYRSDAIAFYVFRDRGDEDTWSKFVESCAPGWQLCNPSSASAEKYPLTCGRNRQRLLEIVEKIYESAASWQKSNAEVAGESGTVGSRDDGQDEGICAGSGGRSD